MKKKLEGKNKWARYSVHTINIALSLFLRSKHGFDYICASRLISLLSPRLLASKISIWNYYEGGHPSIYLSIYAEIYT